VPQPRRLSERELHGRRLLEIRPYPIDDVCVSHVAPAANTAPRPRRAPFAGISLTQQLLRARDPAAGVRACDTDSSTPLMAPTILSDRVF